MSEKLYLMEWQKKQFSMSAYKDITYIAIAKPNRTHTLHFYKVLIYFCDGIPLKEQGH